MTERPSAGARAFVAWTLRWGRWLWAGALLLAVPATVRTVELYAHLRSEMEQLLPPSAPSVVALDELRSRLPGVMHLGVIVDAGDSQRVPAAERFIDDLAAKVRAYPPELVRTVRTGSSAERKFVEDHAVLYAPAADLDDIRKRIEARRDWEVAKEQGALLDPDESPPPLDMDDIQRRFQERNGSPRRLDDDRFASRELHLVLMLVELGRFDTGRSRAAQLLDRVQEDAARLGPDRYAPGMRVGFTSDVAINVEETRALLSDLSVSSVLVLVLVVAVILFYYGWWQSVPILVGPLVLAAIFAFALASLPPIRVTELNSNTAFLGSIIVGNGINFGIVLLARYVEERRAGADAREALVAGVWGARTGTLSAALAAAASYASLALTDFRGFRQFGFIGGLGMLLSWLFAFVLMPPLILWIDRAPRLPPSRVWIMPTVARWLYRGRLLVLVVTGVLVVAAVWRVRSFGPTQIETDFSMLRRADTWKNGEGYWGRRMDALLGSYVTPTVILADDPAQARAIGAALVRQASTPPLDVMVARVRTLDDVVPPEQSTKIAIAERIRDDLTPRVRASLTDTQRTFVDRLLGSGLLRPITPADVPEGLTTGLRERDGSIGRTVLVFPRPGHFLWEGPSLAEFVSRLRAAAELGGQADRPPARVASSLALSADILDRVRHDGVLASGTAFCAVVAVVLGLLRARWSTVLVLGSLVLGVLWMAAAMMGLGVKINFVNFIAFPITFGIGVDYAVNMASRWELEKGGASMLDAVQSTGGAVTLCSATTIIGYSSLLLAENRALFLFGVLAVLGEISCLVAAIVVLPVCASYLVSWPGPSARREPSHDPLP
jgi:uncharacterized protein